MSRRTEAKNARRNKRRAARESNWLPDNVLDELVTQAAIVTDLETFDQRITQRGWTFDEEESDEDFVFWCYGPSSADVDEDEVAPVTTIWMSATEDAEVVHLMLAGMAEDNSFAAEELFEHLDAIEAYRDGDPPPELTIENPRPASDNAAE